MTDANGSYDWEARMRRLEDAIEQNWEDHARLDRNIAGLHDSLVKQKENVDALLSSLRPVIDQQDWVKEQLRVREEDEKQHRLRMAEFDEKLNALINSVSRMQGGMESQPHG